MFMARLMPTESRKSKAYSVGIFAATAKMD